MEFNANASSKFKSLLNALRERVITEAYVIVTTLGISVQLKVYTPTTPGRKLLISNESGRNLEIDTLGIFGCY